MEKKYISKSYEERQEENRKEKDEKSRRMKETSLNTIKWLKDNQKIKEYLKEYNPDSIQKFFEHYATKKKLFMEYGEALAGISERKSMQYIEVATKCLKLIQTKKLYDLRRQWGANLVKVEGVETALSFLLISLDVFNTKVIPPISAEELDVFMMFLKSPNYEITSHSLNYGCNNVSFVRLVEDKFDADLGDWFEFNNNHTGNSKYLLLPDIRGNKEVEYCELAFNELKNEREQKIRKGEFPEPAPHDPRPILDYYEDDFIKKFVEKFEDKETIKKYEGYNNYHSKTKGDGNQNDDYLNEKVDMVVRDMLKLEKPLTVKANKDWRLAIMDAWNLHERKSIINSMITAYEDYLFHIENKILFEVERVSIYENMEKNHKEKLLRGRELKGEPLNFDY